jgi:type IV pilus assembly protein PilM
VATLTAGSSWSDGVNKNSRVRRVMRWLDALAHPPLAFEVGCERIAGVRWTRAGAIEGFAVERVPAGAILASPVEPNLMDAAAVKTALENLCRKLQAKDEEVAVLLPDPVVRVFVQRLEEFPRATQEAIAMLKWKLKKSVPFEGGEMLMSYMKRPAREGGVDVVTALARLRIVREYEELFKSVELYAGVILSSSLAAVAMLEGTRPTMLARVADGMLTTTVVRDGELCGYRCTELPTRGAELTPQMLLDEIFPLAAYYQDQWKEGIDRLLLGGVGGRLEGFVKVLKEELHCKVESPYATGLAEKRIPEAARPLVEQELQGLVGWMMNRV